MKSQTILVLFVVLYALIEAKKHHNHTPHSDSSKWKNFSTEHNLTFVHDQEETDA